MSETFYSERDTEEGVVVAAKREIGGKRCGIAALISAGGVELAKRQMKQELDGAERRYKENGITT